MNIGKLDEDGTIDCSRCRRPNPTDLIYCADPGCAAVLYRAGLPAAPAAPRFRSTPVSASIAARPRVMGSNQRDSIPGHPFQR